MRYVCVILTILIGACGPHAPLARSADAPVKPPAARRSVQQQLRNRLPEMRAEAFRKLKEFPPMEAARLVVSIGFSDREQDVRRAAYEALLTFRNDEEVAHFLLKTLEKQPRVQTDVSVTGPLVAVLLASDSEEIRRELRDLLDRWQAKSKAGSTALIHVADEMGLQTGPQALASLREMIQLRYFSDVFAFRRAVVQAITRVDEPEAVGVLIQLLTSTDGEVRGDIVRYLSKVTGQPQDLRLDAWRAWWKKHKDGFQLPLGGAAAPAPAVPQNAAAGANAANGRNAARPLERMVTGGVPSYYGISIHARRLVFVFDVSSSMNEPISRDSMVPRLAAAKRELVSAINALPEDTSFGIVVFNHMVSTWQSNLVPANKANKLSAVRYVAALQASGMTATCDALHTALRFDVEAIYFLTDGAPTAGKIIDKPDIVTAVNQINRTRRISIYVIGIPPDEKVDNPVLAQEAIDMNKFLQALAEQNYGLYRRVK